ncbi:hypothetical protein FRB96_006972 [Tulasnella sp. 330]|nr:hypothetical protein FRB96_006972 [Tulasnella sp. 330]KAG8883820.1 hypothetical protein FRB97_005823 [Tulasnella sp. 331]
MVGATQASSSRHPSLTPPPDSDSQGEQAEQWKMSARVLRKGKARARVVDDDESDDDFQNDNIKAPPRKKATRNSTRLAEVSSSSSNVELPLEVMTTVVPFIVTPADEDIKMEVDPTLTSTPSEPAPSEREPSVSVPPPVKPAKVRLKLSKLSKAPTPSEPEDDAQSRESEAGDQDGRASGDSEAEDDAAVQAVPAGGSSSAAPTRTAPLTARQAALAGVASGSTEHLSLDAVELSRRVKATPKTEEEIALKKREAAKRRKIQMELKVKEEKEGAVDRLLNKQAPRPRMRRTQTGTGTGTPSGYVTPPVNRSVANDTSLGGGDDTRSTSPDDGSASGGANIPAIPPPVPTSFRWISTTREGGGTRPLIEIIEPAGEVPDAERMDTTPSSITDDGLTPAAELTTGSAGDSMAIDADDADPSGNPSAIAKADGSHATPNKNEPKLQTVFFSLSIPPSIMPTEESRPRSIPTPQQLINTGCGVAGCEALKRYRVILEGGEEKAACGLEHFKLLKGPGTK